MNESLDTDTPDETADFASHWWLNIIRGTAALLLGLGLLLPVERYFAPDALQDILLSFIAIYLFSSGLMSLIWGFSNQRRHGLWLAAGILGIVGGFVFLFGSFLKSQLSEHLLTLFFGVIMLLTGLVHFLGGFRLGKKFGRRWSLGHEFLGLVEIILGFLLLISLFIPVEDLKFILSFWGLIAGSGLLLEGFRMRKRINAD